MNDAIVTDVKRSQMYQQFTTLRTTLDSMVAAAQRRLQKGEDSGDRDVLRSAQALKALVIEAERTFNAITAPDPVTKVNYVPAPPPVVKTVRTTTPNPEAYLLHIHCNSCGHKYDLTPIVPDPDGGGLYSSSADFCVKCGSSKLTRS